MHEHTVTCIESRGGRLYCKEEAMGGFGGAAPVKMRHGLWTGMMLDEQKRREAMALRLVRAKADLLPRAEVSFEWDDDRIDRVTVYYTLFSGRSANDRVKWDDRGAYLLGPLGESWRLVASERREAGELRRDR